MFLLRKYLNLMIFMTMFFCSGQALADKSLNIPILCYHNLNPTTKGSMNLTPQKFEEQMQWLKDHGYTFVPLQDVVAYLQGKKDALPAKPVVITADDGWQSVYQYMFPIAKKYQLPITLFIYPETISHGKNAMTWEELKELQATGLFDIQSHTYGHPNFKQEKKHMSAEAYAKFVKRELVGSKKMLEEKMGTKVTILAWPFGIYNAELEKQAAEAGYEMAFTIDYKKANRRYAPMAQPRFMIIDSQSMKTFSGLVGG